MEQTNVAEPGPPIVVGVPLSAPAVTGKAAEKAEPREQAIIPSLRPAWKAAGQGGAANEDGEGDWL